MIKFTRANTHDLYAMKAKNPKIGQAHRQVVSSSTEELEPPKHISLESLQALVDDNGLESPKAISLESLIAYSQRNHGQDIPEAETRSAENVAGPSTSRPILRNTKSNAGIPKKARQLDGSISLAIAVAALSGANSLPQLNMSFDEESDIENKPILKNRRRSERPPGLSSRSASAISLTTSEQIINRRRYERPASSTQRKLTKSTSALAETPELKAEIPKPVPEKVKPSKPLAQKSKSPKTSESSEEDCKSKATATKSDQKEKTSKILQKKHEILLEKLKELDDEENLEAWLNSLNIPKEINVPELREKISEFLKVKCWESGKENSRWLLDGSFTKRLWSDFKELSTAKQIIIIIGISVLIALVGFLTLQLLSFLWPSLLGMATSGESILVEIGVEAFKQRQEPAFHLLLNHAEQAKPLTTAWANQYVLWKYIRH